MKKNLLFILLLILCFGLFACAKNDKSSDAIGDKGYSSSSRESYEGEKAIDPSISGVVPPKGDGKVSYDDGEATGYSSVDPMAGAVAIPGESEFFEPSDLVEPVEPVDPDEPVTGEPVITPGQLTASAYFDNDHYEFWKGLLTTNQSGDGTFKVYNDYKKFFALNRVKVVIEGVPYAKVTIDDFTGVTDSNGVVYLFPKEGKETYTANIEIVTDNGVVSLNKEVTDNELTITAEEFNVSVEKAKLIQLMFIVDTTGSMGDEIGYLKAEIVDVINKVKEYNEDVVIYLGLVFYRDLGDDYVTRMYDFTTDITLQQSRLQEEYAYGGGDFPEAVTKAFEKALEAQWVTFGTKIIVHVADAPDHSSNYEKWYDATLKCAAMGIRVITIASSGIDTETEYFFRCEALLTNGCYGYLTDDSGIGYSHHVPTTEETMPVEYLNAMLVRLIDGFYTGEFKEAVSWRGQE